MVKAEEKLKELELVIEPAELKGDLDTIVYVPVDHEEPVTGIRSFIPSRLFSAMVIAPVALGFVYNFFIASERFVSTASFVVREQKQGSGLAAMLEGGGLGRSDENSYAVSEFIKSRDAAFEINRDGFLSRIFAPSDVDIFSRFPGPVTGNGQEDFYKHLQHYIDVDFNVSTGITTLSVQSFSPESSRELAQRLVSASEKLVNGLNDRAQGDATRFAERLVEESRSTLEHTQRAVTDFRNNNRMLSVDAEVSVSSGLIGDLLESITRIDTEISQVSALSRDNPRLTDLRQRRLSLVNQVDQLRQQLAGGDTSVANKLEQFEAISIRQKIAQTNLVNAEAALLKARQSAATEKLYLDNIVEPNIPDKYGFPQRFWNMGLLIFVCMSSYIIVSSLRDLIMEEG